MKNTDINFQEQINDHDDRIARLERFQNWIRGGSTTLAAFLPFISMLSMAACAAAFFYLDLVTDAMLVGGCLSGLSFAFLMFYFNTKHFCDLDGGQVVWVLILICVLVAFVTFTIIGVKIKYFPDTPTEQQADKIKESCALYECKAHGCDIGMEVDCHWCNQYRRCVTGKADSLKR